MPLPQVPLSDAELYEFANKAVLPAWALLALFPRSKLTPFVVMATGLAISAVYVGLFANLYGDHQGELPSLADVATLDGLTKAFQTAGVLLPAWVHYLAQDLFVARWVVGDACNKRIPRLVMLPVVALALLFGPAGPLAYFMAVRPLFGKSATTPKAAKQQPKQAAAAAKPAPAPTAASAPKNGAASKVPAAADAKNGKKPAAAQPAVEVAAKPAAPAAQPAKNGKKPGPKGSKGAGALAVAAAIAASEAVKKEVAKKAAAAPKPQAPPPPADMEDDRAFALAAAALLRSRAQPKK